MAEQPPSGAAPIPPSTYEPEGDVVTTSQVDYNPTDQSAFWARCWRYKVHTLKTVQPYFRDVKLLRKTFEIRRDDRGFQPGDLLVLAEWDGDWTGQDCVREVTYVLRDGEEFGVQPGYVVLGLRMPTTTEPGPL